MKLETADYALIVSLFSAATAIAAFVWNVWSKWLYPKAKLKLGFAYVVAHFGDGPLDRQPRFLRLSMTNFGPTELTVTMVALVQAPDRFWQKPRHAIVNPMSSIYDPNPAGGPFAGILPKKLGVGETFDLFFPPDSEFATFNLRRLGMFDTFGRFHGAPRKHLKMARTEAVDHKPAAPFSRPEEEPTQGVGGF
ncbi:hypothetical protein D3C72_377340 [compost metagenome]